MKGAKSSKAQKTKLEIHIPAIFSIGSWVLRDIHRRRLHTDLRTRKISCLCCLESKQHVYLLCGKAASSVVISTRSFLRSSRILAKRAMYMFAPHTSEKPAIRYPRQSGNRSL